MGIISAFVKQRQHVEPDFDAIWACHISITVHKGSFIKPFLGALCQMIKFFGSRLQ